MGKVLISSNYMTDIADAVRYKLGTTDKIEISALAEKILSISDGVPLSILADGYSSAGTYNIDDLVTYQGKLYKRIVDTSMSESFNDSNWKETTIGSELASILKGVSADERYY